MTVDEFDTALSDLETRVDRLRALYENWFRGYEKLEPGVARKDVERRVYGLRKELPRNTALRFRYHQLYQRYTTLATYWQRTARQIEEGTYRRQLQRIKRRRDDEVARTLAPPAHSEESSAPPPSFELNLDETLDVRKLLDDFDLDQVASALQVPEQRSADPLVARAPAAQAAQPPEPARAVARFARPNASAEAGAAGMARGSLRPPANDVAPAAPRPANDVAPSAGKPPALPPGARGVPPPPPPARGTGTVPLPPPGRGTGTVPLPPPARGTGTVPLPPPPSAARAAVPAPVAGARPPAASATQPMATRPPALPPASQLRLGSAPRPPSTRPRPPSNRPGPAQHSGTTDAVRAPHVSGSVARVDASGSSAREPRLDEQRMRRIYEEYAAAKRKNNEGEVRYETLAGSISKMMPDLAKKHMGKQIDFEVVLKDGRVGLKPKAT